MKRALGLLVLQAFAGGIACGSTTPPAPRPPTLTPLALRAETKVVANACPEGSAEDLTTRAFAAKKLGRFEEARNAFDCAVSALEVRTGSKLALDAPGALGGVVEDIAWSPKGTLLAYASRDVVTVLDGKTFRPRVRVLGTSDIRSIALDANDGLLAIGTKDEVSVIELATGKRVATYDDHAPVAFVGNAKKLAAVHGDHISLRGPDGAVEKTIRRPGKSGKKIDLFAFSADGDRLVMSQLDEKSVDLLEVSTGKVRTVASETQARGLAIAGDGSIVAIGGDDGHGWERVRVLDFGSGKLLTTPRSKRAVTDVAVSHDGKIIAGSGTLTARIWTMPLGFSTRKLLGPKDTTTAIALQPHGSLVAAGGKDHGIFVWDLRAKTLHEGTIQQDATVASIVDGDEPSHAAAFSPDGKALAVSTGESSVRLWDLATGAPPRRLQHVTTSEWVPSVYATQIVQLGTVRALAFSADGRKLAYGATDGWLRIFDRDALETSSFPEHGAVDLVGFLDGSVLAAGRSGTVRVHPLAGSKLDRTLAKMRGVALSRDGKTLAARVDESLRIVDAKSGASLATLKEAPKVVAALAFDREALTLAAASDRVRVWDTKGGALIRSFGASSTPLSGLDVAPDGKTIATGDEKGVVRLFGSDGTEKWSVQAADAEITSVTFSPDGRSLALTFSGSNDAATRLLSVATGHTLLTLGTIAGSDGAFVRAANGTFELFGDAKEAAVCRVGALVQPIELCEGRFVVEGLLAKTLASQ